MKSQCEEIAAVIRANCRDQVVVAASLRALGYQAAELIAHYLDPRGTEPPAIRISGQWKNKGTRSQS